MGAVTAKYYQKCDFCHNDIELESGELRLHSISLPGFENDRYSKNRKALIKADICTHCEEKLRNILSTFLSVKENDGRTDIEWENNN